MFRYNASKLALNGVYMIALYAMLGIGGSVYSILVFAALAFALAKVVVGRLTLVRDRMVVAMAIAGAAYYASGVVMIALNPGDAGNYELLIQRLPFLGFLPLFAQLVQSDRAALRSPLEQGAMIGALGVGLWAAWDLFAGLPRAAGAPGNSGPFATTAAALAGICLLALADAKGRLAILFALATLSAAFALVASGMRTLYPALIVLPLVGLVLMPGLRKRLQGRWGLAGAVALVLVLFAAGGVLAERFGALIGDLVLAGLQPEATSSLGQRVAMWRCALLGTAEAPIFGMGRQDAMAFMGQCTLDLVGQALTYSHYHNAALNALIMGGVVELAAFASVFLVPLMAALKAMGSGDRHGAALLLMLLAIFGLNALGNVTLGNDLHDALFIHLATVGLALVSTPPKTTVETKPSESHGNRANDHHS